MVPLQGKSVLIKNKEQRYLGIYLFRGGGGPDLFHLIFFVLLFSSVFLFLFLDFILILNKSLGAEECLTRK